MKRANNSSCQQFMAYHRTSLYNEYNRFLLRMRLFSNKKKQTKVMVTERSHK